jgi:hypothetical protein
MNFCEWLCWLLLAAGLFVGRAVGSVIGRRTGARHAVAWFGALLGFSAVPFLLEAATGNSVRDHAKNALAPLLIIAAILATAIEAATAAVEVAKSSKTETAAMSLMERPVRRFRFRSLLVVVFLGMALLAAYCFVLVPYFRFGETRDRIEGSVRELAQHRPDGVSKRQWSYVVGWTGVAVGNVFFVPSSVKDEQRYYDFADELERRLQGRVEMSTIDWIWDRYEELGEHGRSYSERFRPTVPARLREAEQMPPEIDVP